MPSCNAKVHAYWAIIIVHVKKATNTNSFFKSEPTSHAITFCFGFCFRCLEGNRFDL